MMRLSEAQWEALGWAASGAGGWPRAVANERSWAIRSYRSLEHRGLVLAAGSKTVHGELRVHFIATEAGRTVWAERGAEAGSGQ